MGQVSGIGAKLSLDGINLGTKSMTNIMQSKEAWAQGILKADRAEIDHAPVLNHSNDPKNRYRSGNGNLYGALSLGLALNRDNWQSQDPTATKRFGEWRNNLNDHPLFRPRNSYTPAMLLQIASDADAAACALKANVKELTEEAELGPQDIQYWKQVATGLEDYSHKLQDLHHAICQKQDPEITQVSLDIAAKQH